MIGGARPSRNPAGRTGFLTNLLALANAFATFFETRAALFTSESKQALLQAAVLIGCLVAALIFFIFGYIFLVASAVVGVAHLLQVDWIWIALCAAGAHFLLAIIFVLIGRGQLRKRPFPETAIELKKDREWLKKLDQTSKPLN